MKYRFFSIPAMMPEDMQDDMNRFCTAHRVISIEKQFVQDGERSYWAVCVSYVEKQAGPLSPRKGNVDYREVLSAADFALFAKLRDLRKRLAEREGVPAYALFTNEQLAQMAQQRELAQDMRDARLPYGRFRQFTANQLPGTYTKTRSTVMSKKLPTLTSDEEAEAFLDSADLSKDDLSDIPPAKFECLKKSAKLNMRLPESLFAAIKAKADAQGDTVPTLLRQVLEADVRA
jgi:predicted DNA binding CopG/RHH family protein